MYDADCCEASASIIVCPGFKLSLSSISENCATADDGVVKVEVNVNSTEGYPYTINLGTGASLILEAGVTSVTFDGLNAGAYTVTIQDNCGAEKTESIIVESENRNDILEVLNEGYGLFGDVTDCGGAFIAEVTGGVPPYNLEWSNGETGTLVSELQPGSYTLTVTDFCGSVAVKEFIVGGIDYNFDVVRIKDAVGCGEEPSNGQLCLGPNIGFTWDTHEAEWSTGEVGMYCINNLASGNYSLTITDKRTGCSESRSYFVGSNIPSAPVVTADITSTCGLGGGPETGSIELTIDGNYESLTWNILGEAPFSSNKDIYNLSPGWYYLTITYEEDGVSCTSVNRYKVSSESFDLNVETTNTCFGSENGEIVITPLGGTPPYTFQWDNLNSTSNHVRNLPPGGYRVLVTDGNGCTSTKVVKLGGVAFYGKVEKGCDPFVADGEIKITSILGTPPFSYQWSTGATGDHLTGLEIGSYSVTVTDAEGCSKERSISVLPVNFPEMFPKIESECSGNDGSIRLPLYPGYAYMWSNGVTSPNNTDLEAGNYTATITNSGGCEKIKDYIVPGGLDIILESVQNNYACEDGHGDQGRIKVSANAGVPPYTYEWSNGATGDYIKDLENDFYTVTVTDSRGCSSTKTFSIYCCESGASISAVASITELSSPTSSDGAIQLDIAAGDLPYTVVWKDEAGNYLGNSESLSNLSAGRYFVMITDGCSQYYDWWMIKDCDSFKWNVKAEIEKPCFNGNVLPGEVLSQGWIDLIHNDDGSTPPYTYNWSRDGRSFSNPQAYWDGSGIYINTPGTYAVTITDKGGCSKSIEFGTIYNSLSTTDYESCRLALFCDGTYAGGPIINGIKKTIIDESTCSGYVTCNLGGNAGAVRTTEIYGQYAGTLISGLQDKDGNCIAYNTCRLFLDPGLTIPYGNGKRIKSGDGFPVPCPHNPPPPPGCNGHDADNDGICDPDDPCPFTFGSGRFETVIKTCPGMEGKRCVQQFFCGDDPIEDIVECGGNIVTERFVDVGTCDDGRPGCIFALECGEEEMERICRPLSSQGLCGNKFGSGNISINAFPNPFTSEFTIQLMNPGVIIESAEFRITNSFGKVVDKFTRPLQYGEEVFNYTFPEGYSSGIYYLYISNKEANLLQTIKLIKQSKASMERRQK